VCKKVVPKLVVAKSVIQVKIGLSFYVKFRLKIALDTFSFSDLNFIKDVKFLYLNSTSSTNLTSFYELFTS